MKITEAAVRLLEHHGERFAGRFHPDLELQIMPGEEMPGAMYHCQQKRIPACGDSETPRDNDCECLYPFDEVGLIGCSGWNWRSQVSEWWGFDFDASAGHKQTGLTDQQLNEIEIAASALPYVEVRRSKGGAGRHFFVRAANPPAAPTRAHHKAYALAILQKMTDDTGFPFGDYIDVAGGNMWIWAKSAAPDGFEIIKPASAALIEIPEPMEPETPQPAAPQSVVDALAFPLQQFLDDNGVAYREKRDSRGVKYELERCPFDSHKEPYKSAVWLLDSGKPYFKCLKTGCAEHNWQSFAAKIKPSKPGRKSKADPAATIVKLAMDQDELFHSPDGQAYVMTTRRGRSETILIKEAAYRQGLRLRFEEATKVVAKREWLNNAIDHLEAIAIERGQTHKVCLRLGEHDGKVYLDLADDSRSIVEVDADGWRLANDCPIRFRRTPSMEALPMPERGGSLADLRPLVNVSDDDWPLFVAGLVMMLNPHGPYPLMSLIGREGSAKSSLAYIVQSLIDPTQAKGNCESDSTEDLMIAAQQRWLIAFDNLDKIDQRLSDALCRLSTGGSYSRRTKYEDVSETLLSAKCPVLLTSVNDVVKAADLLDRSLRFELPVVNDAQRMTERAFLEQFAAVRARVLGVLLDGVSSAIRNLPNVRIENPPRMADFAHWATAAEEGLGLPSASTLNSYRQNRAEVAELILDSDLASSIREIASEGFAGTAKELAERIEWAGQPKTLSDALRKIERALGDAGVVVGRKRRTNVRLIEIAMRQAG